MKQFIKYSDVKMQICEFLSAQSDDYFAGYGKTRESVMNDSELMTVIFRKYVHLVNVFEVDPQWALSKAFEVAMKACDKYLIGDEIMVTIQGPYCKFRVIAYRNICGYELTPGDLYIAKRNTGWQLAKCHSVNHDEGWVNVDLKKRIMYSYDCSECHKVKSLEVIPECGAVIRKQEEGYVCPNCDKCDSCDFKMPDTNCCLYVEWGLAEWALED